MRMAILLSALATAVALADTPPAAAPSADAAKTPTTAAATATTAAASASTAATTPAPSAETLKKARGFGLMPRKRKGKTMYCQDVADIGTRFTTEHCYDEENLEVKIRELEATREQMQKSTACGGAGCGSR